MTSFKQVTRKTLLKVCKYYKGERTCPSDTNEMFWNYERSWMGYRLDADSDFLHNCLEDYHNAGLFDFEQNDGVPDTLKALLFDRFCHWNSGTMLECVEPFKKFYRNKYRSKDMQEKA